jgi:HSP20 family protein
VCCPTAELAEADGEYALKVALAGFDPKDISVTATPHEILIKAAHEHEKSGGDDKASVRWSEFRSNSVFRRVALPDAVDVSKIAASLKNGLLELTAPKVAGSAGAEKPRKVKLSTPS